MRRQENPPSLEVIATLALAALALGFILKTPLFAVAAALLLAVGLFLKRFAALIAAGWMAAAKVLGKVNAAILLSVVFYVVLTPLAFASRIFRKDPLVLRPEESERTAWCVRDHHCSAADFEKMW